MPPLSDTLTRLQAIINAAHLQERPPAVVTVELRDLAALLSDHERLDADARAMFPIHATLLRTSLAKLREHLLDVDAALSNVPSAHELARRRQDETRRKYPPHGVLIR